MSENLDQRAHRLLAKGNAATRIAGPQTYQPHTYQPMSYPSGPTYAPPPPYNPPHQEESDSEWWVVLLVALLAVLIFCGVHAYRSTNPVSASPAPTYQNNPC